MVSSDFASFFSFQTSKFLLDIVFGRESGKVKSLEKIQALTFNQKENILFTYLIWQMMKNQIPNYWIIVVVLYWKKEKERKNRGKNRGNLNLYPREEYSREEQ